MHKCCHRDTLRVFFSNGKLSQGHSSTDTFTLLGRVTAAAKSAENGAKTAASKLTH